VIIAHRVCHRGHAQSPRQCVDLIQVLAVWDKRVHLLDLPKAEMRALERRDPSAWDWMFSVVLADLNGFVLVTVWRIAKQAGGACLHLQVAHAAF
jgi:hypothetical protein